MWCCVAVMPVLLFCSSILKTITPLIHTKSDYQMIWGVENHSIASDFPTPPTVARKQCTHHFRTLVVSSLMDFHEASQHRFFFQFDFDLIALFALKRNACGFAPHAITLVVWQLVFIVNGIKDNSYFSFMLDNILLTPALYLDSCAYRFERV